MTIENRWKSRPLTDEELLLLLENGSDLPPIDNSEDTDMESDGDESL